MHLFGHGGQAGLADEAARLQGAGQTVASVAGDHG